MKTIIKKAETFRRALKLTDSQTHGVPDLSQCSARSQMRTAPAGVLLGEAICTIDTERGIVYALWTSDQTAEWASGDAGYDIWLICQTEQKPIFTERVTIADAYTEMNND